MNLREALRNAMGMLTGAGVPSVATATEVLLLHILAKDRAYLYAHSDEELLPEQQREFQSLLERRAAGTPTQYLTGKQEFWGLEFHVEPGVLIPRPETEHVVEAVLKIVREKLRKPNARIVDVGAGSGCIALSLAHELPQAVIHAVDVSDDALRIARENAERLGFAERVQFTQGDLLGEFLSPVNNSQTTDCVLNFDLVVSNPPYVSHNEEEILPREVREHEPRVALFSDEEGLGVARRLLEQAKVLLHPDGHIVLELGYNQAQRVRSLVNEGWTDVEITNDLRGTPRVLAARRR